MKAFAFYPELFELRTSALDALADGGFAWLADFGSVDLLHDVYGLEVCGITDEDSARAIEVVLRALFPAWPYVRCYLKDFGGRDPGWKVIIARDPETADDDSWKT